MLSSRPTLLAHERLLVLVICGGMLFLSIIAFSAPYIPPVVDTVTSEDLPPSLIHVTITGEVGKPGLYTLEKGATLHDLLEMAAPLPSVDLQKVKMGSKLRDGQVVDLKKPVPKKEDSLGRGVKSEKKGKNEGKHL